MSRKRNEKKQIHFDSYKYGFSTDIESEVTKPGLNEGVIENISKKKNEPSFMLTWRLDAYKKWKTMFPPRFANVNYEKINIDYQNIVYYSAPKQEVSDKTDDINPKLIEAYNKLGVQLGEDISSSRNVAVDAIFDSVSVATTYREDLRKIGIIFCPFSEAVVNHPELVKKYLGSVVSSDDNFFAALNAAVFSDGSFVYIPKGIRCPIDLSSYFRINTPKLGQFERTLIIAEDDSYVSYLEGCSATMRDENQLHAAVVELVAMNGATIKYSTVQNWYPGDKDGNGGIYNFVTKRAACLGKRSKVAWLQVETGSAITWKYPGTILIGDDSSSDFYSVSLAKNHQQTDTGTKMIHIGRNTKSFILSKSISADFGSNTYRSLVVMDEKADGAKSSAKCDSLLIGKNCSAHAFPVLESGNGTADVQHEASVSTVKEEHLMYCMQRGISADDALAIVINGFCKSVFSELPMEFAVEVQKLISIES